jgi:predicted permease
VRWFTLVRLRLASLFLPGRANRDLDRELASHIDQQVEELVARGMEESEARRIAVSTFGGVQRVREESRDARRVAVVESVVRDLRYTLRGLLREPMLIVAATISIALGAGGNLAVFTLAREFVFAKPDLRQPDQVVQMQVSHGSHVSYQRWLDLDASGALEAFAGYGMEKQVNWRNGDATTALVPMIVTANFFDVTGVPVALGRGFFAAESRAEDEPRLAVLSHAFWQSAFHGDSSVPGRVITLNGQAFTIVGVLAPRVRTVVGFAISPPIYLPLSRTLVPELTTPGAPIVRPIGRLKPGQSLEQGRAAVDAADRRLGRLQGDTVYAGVQEFSPVGTLAGPKSTRVIGSFFVLLALVSLMVLLIACANVAGLLIARATRRRPEIAIRLAIGGTRLRLVQQFLLEGFWLALLGTVAGLALSVAFMKLVNGMTLPVPIPLEIHLAPDRGMFAVAVGVVLLTIVLCGLLPAFGATRLPLVPALRREEPFYAVRRVSLRGVLLTGQVAVSTVLLVTAFLFVRNLARTQVTDPGFEVRHALVAQVGFVQGRPPAEHVGLLQRAAEQLQALPDIESVTIANAVPLTMYNGSSSGLMARIDDRAAAQHVEFSRSFVGPVYFATMNVRLVAGREFLPTDLPGTPAVAIVNEEFARRYYEGRSPVGSRLRFEDRGEAYDIVGVVANGKHRTLGEEQRAALYLPLLQHPEGLNVAFVLARTRPEAAALAPSVRSLLGALDRSVSIEVQPMESALRFALLPSRIGAVVLGTLGVLGLILASFGLYALVSFTVSRRVGEIAIRSALGATRGGILRLVIRDAGLLVGAGVVLGLAVAALVTAPLATFLATGLSATDPLSFGGTALAFLVVSLLASWLPANRATRVSPAVAMRLD